MLVSLILIPLFLAILQLGLALWVRNTIAACAQDAARYAADEDFVANGSAAMTAAGTAHAAACVNQSLSTRFSQHIVAGPMTFPPSPDDPTLPNRRCGTVSGQPPVQVVEVRITASIPLVGLFGLGGTTMTVCGDALQERR